MRNIWLIARREYLERVRTKSFIIMTLLIPAFMFAFTVGPTFLVTKTGTGEKHLVVVASNAKTAEIIRQELVNIGSRKNKPSGDESDQLARQRPPMGKLSVDVDTDTSDAHRAALTEQVNQKKLDGIIWATNDALEQKRVKLITRDVSSMIMTSEIEDAMNDALHRDLLKSKGLSEQEIDKALQPVSLRAESPSGMSNPRAVFFTILSMVMVLYVTTLLYGINVMRAILDEKTSRIMEVMLSVARPWEMMAGKILGVGAVGLTQILIWGVFASVPASMGLVVMASMLKGILSIKLLVYFGVFFLLGYVLYSALCAAVGSMVNSEQEAQQLQFLVMLPMIAGVIIMVSSLENPGSSLAVAGSLFPLTAPLVMFLRIALGAAPPLQIALSIALMVATAAGLVWLCARIYRIGILMYGKKPTLPELMKWIRYA
jgi:ABC-2 type transport system permease protein